MAALSLTLRLQYLWKNYTTSQLIATHHRLQNVRGLYMLGCKPVRQGLEDVLDFFIAKIVVGSSIYLEDVLPGAANQLPQQQLQSLQ